MQLTFDDQILLCLPKLPANNVVRNGFPDNY